MKDGGIAIVGGGLGGLVAAIDVARRGGKSILFEATGRLGGRAQTREIDGFHLNQGPHALYLAGSLCVALKDFGVAVTGRGPDMPNGLGLWEGQPHRFPLGRTRSEPEPLDADAVEALQAFYAKVIADPELGRGVALSEVIAPLPPLARLVIEGLIRLSTYIHAPSEVDAKAALDQLRLSFAGTIYVDGGWQNIVEALREAATAAGVVVRTGERVSGITAADGGCRVLLRGEEAEDFGAVVVAAPPKTAAKLVESSAHLEAAVSRTRPVRVVALDLALSDQSSGANFVLGFDEPTYLSVHSAVASLAPDGGAVVHLARYIAPRESPSPDHLEDLERLADRFRPGWRTAVVHQQRLSGATVAHDFPVWSNGGARAPVSLPDAPGVFLAGDWVGDVGMLADATAASARSAAAAATQFVS